MEKTTEAKIVEPVDSQNTITLIDGKKVDDYIICPVCGSTNSAKDGVCKYCSNYLI